MLELSTAVQFVKGIGPRVAAVLEQKGVSTVEDLLYYLPFRYEDRQNPRAIDELVPGEMATVIAEVRSAGLFRTRSGMWIFNLVVGQGTQSLTAMWFHGQYMRDRFKPGQVLALYGRVEQSESKRVGRLKLIQPQVEVLSGPQEAGEEALPEDLAAQSLEIGKIVPIYESAGSGKLTSRWFRRVIHGALAQLTPEVADGIPRAVRARMELAPRREAFQKAHWPDPETPSADLDARRTPAHRRLIFEELFYLEVGLELKRKRMREQPGIEFTAGDAVRAAVKKILPFHPTNAQKRVLGEVVADMKANTPMRRLLQGDVGSGKTIVALQAAVVAIENGYQVALMAPTEILAAQHYLSARRVLEPLGYRVLLLTGSLEPDTKRTARRHIAQGNAQIVIGTHALIQESVEFAKLGLVIVDEQHRFGVMQRFRLMKKKSDEKDPDVLVMTATPIPRTLALTLYGDLDVSVLDELPPGRTPVVTRRVNDERAGEVWEFVRKQVQAGNQAYVVYPVIEERTPEGQVEEESAGGAARATAGGTPALRKKKRTQLALPGSEAAETATKTSGLKAAEKMYNELRKKVFPELRVGLLHGRMDADLKDVTMKRFGRGEIDVLVSTTVIEVGVDVPNANVMVIEHAERFGLSQLHQLRGRIGRGTAKSYCVLMTSHKVTTEGEERLETMVRTNDGFEIAEKDLEQRGPGEFFGTKQAGMPAFRVANLIRDRQLLEAAKKEAAALVAGASPDVTRAEAMTVMEHLRAHWQRRYGLVEVG
ncbi:MAG: ATP-dependent DNA helicase RecG [Candidatus Koribacter versatilis]|uniref:Probable DNA 3'-5' helicase RecG n=1 Tax=Candidatus Korobacter versatilis TaxID=658062 RepID=A0A932A7R1_9BACT|nr:ATP-dependent DNA helicase RecG [Candidatus Koribacter versatilis]